MVGTINGKEIAEKTLDKIAKDISQLQKETGKIPGLTSIMVGDNPASLSFIKIKQKTAQKVGINFERKHFPKKFPPAKIIDFIRQKNADQNTHGIIVQLPLPEHLNPVPILKAIHPFKDVDCLHPKNLGLLTLGQPIFLPPAAKAVQKILADLNIGTAQLSTMKVVLVGGGILVGRPLAIWFLPNEVSFTSCQRHTQDLASHTQNADLLITATGVPHLIKAKMVKENAIVIDFGGDADFEQIAKKALVTPTPGGTGPLTVASLLENVVQAALQ